MLSDGLSARSTSAAVLDRLLGPTLLAGAGLVALALGWLVGHGKATLPAAGVVALALVLAVVMEPRRGLIWAVLMTLLLPASTSFVAGKLNVIRIAAALVILGVVLDIYSDPRVRRLSVVDWAVIGFLVIGLSGWLLDPQPPHGSAFALNYVLPLAFYAGARRFGRYARTILTVVFVGASVASLTVVYEAFVVHRPLFADPTSYYWNATNVYLFRPGGVFGSPPTAAATLAISVLCGLPLLSRARGLTRVALSLCFVTSLAALTVTFTRGPMIGFGVGLITYVVLLGPATWAKYAYVAGGLAIVFTIAFLPTIETTGWFEKGVLRSGTFASRQVVWDQTRSLITNSTEHKLFGHGTNSLIVGLPWLPGQPQADIAQVPDLTLRGAQDQYIRTLIESGFIGLLLFLGWLFGAVTKGAIAAFRGAADRRDVAALVGACVAFATVALVDDALRQSQTFVVLAVVTGLLVSLSLSAARERVGDQA